jgi:hypothetical protein
MEAAYANPREWVSAGVVKAVVVVFWLFGRRVVRSCLVSRPDGRNEGVTATRGRSTYSSRGRRVRCTNKPRTPETPVLHTKPYRFPASHTHTHSCTSSPHRNVAPSDKTASLCSLAHVRPPASSSITTILFGGPGLQLTAVLSPQPYIAALADTHRCKISAAKFSRLQITCCAEPLLLLHRYRTSYRTDTGQSANKASSVSWYTFRFAHPATT